MLVLNENNAVKIPRRGYKLVKSFFGQYEEIPEDWDTIFISDGFKLKTGGTPSRTQPRYFDGNIYWVTSTDLNRSSITSTLENISEDAKEITRLEIFQKGTFVIATYGLEAAETRGKCGILNITATINQACLAFIPTGKITTKFLFYFYLKYGEQIAFNYAQGTKQQNLYPAIVGKIPIIKPPMPEQQKIASILSGVDALIESTQKTVEKTKRLKKGLMQKLLTKGISHTKFKKIKSLFNKYENIPKEWEIRTFEQLFEFLRTGTNSRSDLEECGEIGYIHYGDIHTKWNSVLDCSLEEIPFIATYKVEKLPLLEEGDLIIADASEDHEGSGASILLKNVKNRKIVSGLHTIALRSQDKNISPEFKRYLVSIKFVKNQIIAYVSGISVYGLSKNNLKIVKIPLPSFTEQQKIASILSGVDAYIQKNQQYKERLEKLKKGLMQKLLTGQIRVKV